MFSFNTIHNGLRKSDLQLEIFGNSEMGHKRDSNEDAFLIADLGPSKKLMAVADAFSNRFGEDSSQIAVSGLHDIMLEPSNRDAGQRLSAAFHLIDQDIGRHFRTIHHSSPVGTTLTAIYVQGDTAYIAHVGNSRAYLLREGKVHRLTHDDTFAQVLIESGVEPSETARKILMQALGVDCDLKPMLMQVDLRPDDYLVLCSDGFSNKLYGPEVIKTIENNPNLEVAVERLIDAADERDGEDNITVILARVCRTATFWMNLPIRLQPAL